MMTNTTIRTIAAAWMVGAAAAHAADNKLAPPACGYVAAKDAYAAAYDSARRRVREGDAPPTLQKDKIGAVLVARPAPPHTDPAALRADIEQLARLLEKSSPTVCEEALRVRRKYAL